MAEDPTPLQIQRAPQLDPTARALGRDVAGVLRYQIAVLDREDRLESGTGDWKESFRTDATARELAVKESVLRTCQIALNPECFRILEALRGPENMTTAELVAGTGLGRLTLQERTADLVSAGLAAKVPEADQVVGTAAGGAIVDLIGRAVAVAARELAEVE